MSDVRERPAPRPVIAIPTYNNRATLRDVVERALRIGPPVLVIDDGCTDGAMDTLEGLAVETIRFAENRGKGEAILAVGRWAAERGYSHVITVDADGQHDPADVPRFLDAIDANPMAIVVGRRDFGENVPGSSRFGRAWSNMWIRIACGASCPDSQSGFRAYPVESLTQVSCSGSRYEFEIEILVRAVWAGLELDSVDVSVRYFGEDQRVSHFRPFLDNARISWAYTRLVTRNLMPWPFIRRFQRDPLVPPFSWRRPWRYWIGLHHSLTRRLGPEEKRLSVRHPIRSIKLLHLERTEPREVALATMLGIFLGALPLLATHTIAILFYATRFRLNRPLAFYVSNLCAPFIPPFVPALDIEVGHYLLHGRFLTLSDLDSRSQLMQTLGREAHIRLAEYFVGSLVVGPVLAIFAGAIAYTIARFWRRLRRAKEGAGDVAT